MIIYGSRSSHLRSISLENETCPHCGQQGSMVMSTFTRYAHIFWIPLFSVGRFSLSECKHCRQVMEVKQMPPQISAYHHRNLAETRLPLWQFTGLALVAVAIFFGIYANKVDKEEQAQFVANPGCFATAIQLARFRESFVWKSSITRLPESCALRYSFVITTVLSTIIGWYSE